MKKTELRAVYLEKRRGLSSSETARISRLIADRVFTDLDLGSLGVIHCFISIPRLGEIDTSPIINKLWVEYPGTLTAAPRIDGATGEIQSVPFSEGSPLIENHWGILEPAGDMIIDPVQIDAVLVPLLCFDRIGHQVGYGKGYYDRFLARCRRDCRKIGLSYFEPIDKIDADNHDIALDHCVTPTGTYSFISHTTS